MRLTHANRVLVPATLEWVEREIPPLLTATRQDPPRQSLETSWQRSWRMWKAELDQQSYLGRSQVYLAAVRSAIEAWGVALQDGLFPAYEWFRCKPAPFVDAQRAQRWQALQQRWLTQEMRFEHQMPEFLRQFLTYGTAVARHVWDERYERRRVWERQLDRAPLDTDAEERRIREDDTDVADDPLAFQHQGTTVRLVEKRWPVHVGPLFRPVDLFHFYVAPATASSIETATCVFEDLEIDLHELRRWHRMPMDPEEPAFGMVYDHPQWEQVEALAGPLPSDFVQALQERWQRLGLIPDPSVAYASLAGKGHLQLSEVYWRGEIPGARDETGHEYGERDWLFCFVNDTFCIRAQPNPSYAQQRPWVDARMYRTTGLYYAQGVVDAVQSVQYYLNDIGNLTLDNLVMALNPVVTVDEVQVSNMESLQWAPGAKWFVAKDGVNVLNIPTQAQLGMTTLNMMQGFIHDFTRASAAQQGTPPTRGRGRAAQTASGWAMLQATNSQAMQSVVKDIERQLCEPILARNYHMAEQCMTDQLPLQVLGADGAILLTESVGFEDIFGEYRYEWRGSTKTREQQALVTSLQSFPQMLQFLGPEAIERFNGVEFAKIFLRDGAGITWADTIFRADPAPAIDPRLELELFATHRPAQPQPGDDDLQHLVLQGAALFQDARFQRDPIARQLLTDHLQAHVAAAQAKAAAAQQAQQQALLAAMGGGEEGPPQPGGLNGAGSLPSPAGPAEPADALRAQMQTSVPGMTN